MEVKKAIMKAAEKVYVLADSSKFGGGYLSVICPTNEVYKIITDDGVSKENVSKAKELGCSTCGRVMKEECDGETAERLIKA